jgi:FkbM family methyltransferase
MFRIPRMGGMLIYAAAWLVPWRPHYCVRTADTKLSFFAHRRDVIGRHIAKYGAHEPRLTAWLSRHLEQSPRGIVIDVGANIGWHTIHASRHAAVETVVAFEPDAVNLSLLNRNLQLNGAENVVVCNYALGAREGRARLHRYKESNLGRHSLVSDHGFGDTDVIVRDLDDVLVRLKLADRRISLLKIDVEGYEPAVIEGASQALTRTDVIVLEYTPGLSRKGGLSTDDMLNRLYRFGFRASSLGGDSELTPLEHEQLLGFEGQMDLIWSRTNQ